MFVSRVATIVGGDTSVQTDSYKLMILCKDIDALLHVISLVDWPKHVKSRSLDVRCESSHNRIYATSRHTCGGPQLNFVTIIKGFWLMIRCLRKVPGFRGEDFTPVTV